MSPDSEPTPRVPWLPVNEGAQPPTPPEPEPLTPFTPIVPAWIQREEAPAADEEPTFAEVEQPAADEEPTFAEVEQPAADEVLPSPVDAPLEVQQQPDPEEVPWRGDAVQMLGESAVASAALSAAGAPTPLGGVPTVPADEAITPPSFGDAGPPFAPIFDEEPVEPAESSMAKADALAAGIVANEQAMLASKSADLDGGVAYAPRVFDDGSGEPTRRFAAEPEVAAPEAVPTPAVPAPPAPPSDAKKRRWWIWVLLALLLIAAAAAAYALMNRPDPVVVPGVTVTEPPPSPTITPIAAPTATAFQSSMPTTVGTYSLVEATPLDPADIALTAGRVADGVDLVYRSGDDTMNVRALQYYSEDDATTMFTSFAGEDTATQPVEAGGTTVGESAIITSPKPGMVWRNGTSVFILTGPLVQVSDFYEQFGL